MNDKDKFSPQGTKIDPDMEVVWNEVCNALGTDTYHMLQQFIYAMIRMASSHHNKTAEMQRLLQVLDLDPGWQNAINLCAPKGKLTIEQMVLIVSQEDKKGFGMVMLNKPYIEECVQTENVNHIIERVIEVGMKKLYMKLRDLKESMGCRWLSDVLMTMVDAQTILNMEEEDLNEMRAEANYSEHGRPIEYGKRTKRVQHRTPDSLANSQQRIHFTEEDEELAAYEAEEWEGCHREPVAPEDIEETIGGKPFGFDA